jgi:1-deoxy-D-xylulose-5-phosphate synthase
VATRRDHREWARAAGGNAGPDLAAIDRIGGMDVLARTGDRHAAPDVLLVSVGPMADVCLQVSHRLAGDGIASTVVDPRWVKPVDPVLPGLAARHRLVVTVEDNLRVGGAGSMIVLKGMPARPGSSRRVD